MTNTEEKQLLTFEQKLKLEKKIIDVLKNNKAEAESNDGEYNEKTLVSDILNEFYDLFESIYKDRTVEIVSKILKFVKDYMRDRNKGIIDDRISIEKYLSMRIDNWSELEQID